MKAFFALAGPIAFATLLACHDPARAAGSKTPVPAPSASPSIALEKSPTPIPIATDAAMPAMAAASNAPTILETMNDPEVRSVVARPIPQLAGLAWMTGTWRASHVRVLPAGKTRASTNTFVFAYTMNGRWLFGADGAATDYVYLTYDPFSERWILERLESAPSYGLMTSDAGWHRGRIVFSGEGAYVGGRAYRRRLTIVRRSPHRMDLIAEELNGDALWLTDETIVLTKET